MKRRAVVAGRVAGLIVAVAWLSAPALAQARYAADGPGTYVSIGVTVPAVQSDYGKRLLSGATVFVDANLYRRVGVEARATWLNVHSDSGIRERTLLVGPKLSLRGRTVWPYARLLVGRGMFDFPFGYAHGSYFAMSPGAGLDWRVGRSRLMLRLFDVEYQIWPGFSFGSLHPYGISGGVGWRVY